MGSSDHRCVLFGQLPDQEEHAVEDHGPPPESERDPAHQAGVAAAPDSTYTFGDTDVEAARLALVSEIFGPTSEELLAQAVERPPVLAYDLGCGPGHTTRLVAKATGATLTVGLERSEAHLVRARACAPEGVRFVTWDVGDLPFPAGPADLAYARLLLAHLEDPVAAASSWATQLDVGGLLVVDELEWIATDHSVLQAHLHLASSLVATTGAQMCAGPLLTGIGEVPGLRRRLQRVIELPVPTGAAAAMFEMSLDAWGEGIVAAGLCDRGELFELTSALSALRDSPATGEITWGLHQAVYEVLTPGSQATRPSTSPPATRQPGARSAEGTESDPEEGPEGSARRNHGL